MHGDAGMGKAAAGQQADIRHMLGQYGAALARVKILRESVGRIEDRVRKMNREGYYAADVVNKGKKGKKPLGTTVVSGFRNKEYDAACRTLDRRKGMLRKEEQEMLELTAEVEGYIAGIADIEVRNILTLYYVENLTWVQVAQRMNAGRKKKYTEDSCRHRHDRFFEKNF